MARMKVKTTVTVSEPLKEANVFTMDESRYVFAFSYQIANPNTTISYEVYLLAPDWKSPEDGVLVASGEKRTFWRWLRRKATS